jgi:hypothetical protein
MSDIMNYLNGRTATRAVVLLGCVPLMLAACANDYDPGSRALGGGLIGGGTGAAIGALAGGGRGAAIGALAGGVLGAGAGAVTTPNQPGAGANGYAQPYYRPAYGQNNWTQGGYGYAAPPPQQAAPAPQYGYGANAAPPPAYNNAYPQGGYPQGSYTQGGYGYGY